MSFGILLFVLAILVVIMIHEAGHLAVAKLFGFKATKFFVGFGPKVWSVKKGETEYGVAAIPAGGFVKIVGMNPYEEVDPADEARSYPNKPRWQRALLLVAGSATHWVVAFVLLVITAMTIGFPTGRATNIVAIVETRLKGQPTPASSANIRPGERILAVGTSATPSWNAVREAIRANPGATVPFEIGHATGQRTIDVTLGTAFVGENDRVLEYFPPGTQSVPDPPAGATAIGFFGVQPEPEYAREGPIGALGTGASITWDVTRLSVRGIGEVGRMVFGGELWDALQGEGEREVTEGPLGLVGAGRIAGESVDRGRYLDFIGLIVGFTVFVGLMNLLPLPPLDGGHLAVLAWEKVTGRTVDIRKLIPIAAAVISFFIVLFIAVLYLDLARPIKTPF